MKTKMKLFAFGLVLGAVLAFPLGMNAGRQEPLLSNPLAKVDVQEEVTERVKQGTETVLEGARVKIHEATQPIAEPLADAAN